MALTFSMGAHKNFSTEGQGIGYMASAERKPITGLWGQSPQRGPGAQPLVSGSGAKPPEAGSFKAFAQLKNAQKFADNMPRPSK